MSVPREETHAQRASELGIDSPFTHDNILTVSRPGNFLELDVLVSDNNLETFRGVGVTLEDIAAARPFEVYFGSNDMTSDAVEAVVWDDGGLPIGRLLLERGKATLAVPLAPLTDAVGEPAGNAPGVPLARPVNPQPADRPPWTPRPLMRQTTTIVPATEDRPEGVTLETIVLHEDVPDDCTAAWSDLPELQQAGWRQVGYGDPAVFVRVIS